MSYSTVMELYPGERAERIEELRNSHGSAPFVWNEMAKRYLGFKDFEYSYRDEELWPLYKRVDIPKTYRHVLMITYDNAIVLSKDYKKAAQDIRSFLDEFKPKIGYVNHWARIAEIIENASSPAIGLWCTSVCANPFQGKWNEENEDYDAPDWSIYWSVYDELEKQGIS